MRRFRLRLLAARCACLAALLLAAIAAQAQTADESEEQMRKLVVMLEASLGGEPSIGAGIIAGVRSDAIYIATANHVVRRGPRQAETILVRFRWLAARTFRADLLPSHEADADTDLAVIRVSGLAQLGAEVNTLPFERLGDPQTLSRGDPLYMLGNPGGRQWRINTSPEKFVEIRSDGIEFESNLITRGHSGGALLDGARLLLGMLVSDDPPYGRAIAIPAVIRRLKEWGYPVDLRRPLSQVSAGHQRTCRVSASGQTGCWGETELESEDFTEETRHIDSVRLRSVSVGLYHICGIDNSGEAYCLGSNKYGQLGRNSTGDAYQSILPVQGNLRFSAISSGGWHSCALTVAGKAYCWGAGTEGRLGNDSGQDSPLPVPVAGGLTFKTITTGYFNSCALAVNGAAYCWGGIAGLGDPRGGADPPDAFVPLAVAGALRFTSLSAGYFFVCGVATDGAGYCWGNNEDGQLGNGTRADSEKPVAVSGKLNFAMISAAIGGHACGVTTAGEAYCWGMNSFGQLGNGKTEDSSVPVRVSGGLTFATVSAGHFHSCGVTRDDVTYCWGAVGQNGLGTATDAGSSVPVRVPER